MRHPESIEILATEVRDQAGAQLRHFERLDAQAGVLLGFSGLFVALAPGSSDVWIAAARGGGVVSAMGALLALLAGRYPVLDVAQLRANYLSAEPLITQLTILDARIVYVQEARRLTARKAARLKLTICAQFLAIALAATGLVVDNLS
ncbi:MAG: hypothetical protein M3134_01205 [Actinomycetota bacterium]|nr:hypothetical protein [Actinomycetota bacterium]